MAYLEAARRGQADRRPDRRGGPHQHAQVHQQHGAVRDLTRGPRVIGPEAYEAMQEILEDIQTGRFAREWMLENLVNRPQFNALTKADEEHLIEEVGKEVRATMPQFRT